jgi:hypothetical protein
MELKLLNSAGVPLRANFHGGVNGTRNGRKHLQSRPHSERNQRLFDSALSVDAGSNETSGEGYEPNS